MASCATMWAALDHVVLGVRDLAAAERRYAQLLGRSPSWRGEHPGLGTRNVCFRLRNGYLELLAPGEGAGWLRARLEAEGEGLLGLALATEDADAAAQVLGGRGLHPQPPARGLARDTDSGAFREWRSVLLPAGETRGVLLFGIEHRSAPELMPETPPLAAPAACVHGFDHVVVQTHDADAARALYGERLGLRLALDRSFPQWGVRLLFFRVGGRAGHAIGERTGSPARSQAQASGGVTIELAARLDAASDPEARDRLWGISWRVGDAEAARARLAGAGFEVSEIRTGRRPGTRVFSVHGEPCGVATLMLEPGQTRSAVSDATASLTRGERQASRSEKAGPES